MPLISHFYGILIYLHKEDLPNKQKKIVEAWRIMHEDELRAAWYAYNNDGEIVKIKGLE